MEIRNLRTFVKVAQLNSFSKAAKSLGYTQSTVTTQIKILEKSLNVLLFDRLNKTVKLTDNGSILLQYATDLISKNDEVKRMLSDRDNIAGKLRLGAFESICGAFLPNILGKYHSKYPDVSIELTTSVYKKLENKIDTNQIDIIWFYGFSKNRPGWVKVLEKEYELVIVAPCDHPFTKLKTVTLDMLEKETFIMAEKCCGYLEVFQNSLSKKDTQIRVIMEVDNTETIAQFVKAGLGLSLLPSYTVTSDLKKYGLTIIDVEGISLKMSSQMYYHKKKWVSPAMQAFFELCKKEHLTDEDTLKNK